MTASLLQLQSGAYHKLTTHAHKNQLAALFSRIVSLFCTQTHPLTSRMPYSRTDFTDTCYESQKRNITATDIWRHAVVTLLLPQRSLIIYIRAVRISLLSTYIFIRNNKKKIVPPNSTTVRKQEISEYPPHVNPALKITGYQILDQNRFLEQPAHFLRSGYDVSTHCDI